MLSVHSLSIIRGPRQIDISRLVNSVEALIMTMSDSTCTRRLALMALTEGRQCECQQPRQCEEGIAGESSARRIEFRSAVLTSQYLLNDDTRDYAYDCLVIDEVHTRGDCICCGHAAQLLGDLIWLDALLTTGCAVSTGDGSEADVLSAWRCCSTPTAHRAHDG